MLLTGPLDDALATETAAALTLLESIADAPITLHVDSGDGTLEAAFVLIDTLGHLRVPVHLHCRGKVGGPAIGVVAAATRRSASPHTRFRLTQPTVRYSGTPEQIASQTRQHRDLLWRLQARLAQVTGRSPEDIAEDMRLGVSLDAREALHYGLIDVVEP